jgi:alpha-beta hydrolase superfamily lysophospholipase
MSTRRGDSVRLPLLAGGALQVYVSYQDKPSDWGVVYVHGFGSTRGGEKAVALEAACGRRGWTFASFDFRGHGQSTGTLLELRGSGLLEDLEAMRDYLVGRGMQRYCLVGSSMGGWVSAWFTLRHPSRVVACAMIAPALDFVGSRWELLTQEERERWKQTGRLRIKNQWIDVELGYSMAEEVAQFPVSRLAAELARPMLIFHGLLDDTVPFTQSLNFVERAAYPEIELRLYKNGDHRLLALKDEMAEAACEFFARSVQPLAVASAGSASPAVATASG